MTGQTQAFFHHYRAMDTRVLLARYRSGGLLPEAKTALLEVLADRGYAVEALEGNGADEIGSVRVNGFAETRSVSMKAMRTPSAAWCWFKQKVAVLGAKGVRDGIKGQRHCSKARGYKKVRDLFLFCREVSSTSCLQVRVVRTQKGSETLFAHTS